MEYTLVHSGVSKRDGAKVGSGRYPLGSGKRPFQGDTPAQKEKAKRLGLFRKSKKKKTSAETDKELSEEEKKRIIESGNVREAYQYRKQLTNADIDAVVLRYNKEKTLADLMPKKKKGMDYIKKSQELLENSAKLINSGINVWNAVARINNTYNPEAQMKPIYAIGAPDKKK